MISGFNYGSGDTVYVSYNADKVAADVIDMGRFCGHVRVTIPAYDATNAVINNAKAACLAAKGAGFYVVWGCSASNVMTATVYTAFSAVAATLAAWSQANGIDEFDYGNELELRVDNVTLTYAQFRTNLRADIATAKTANPTLKISYAVDASSYQAWINEGIGTMDYLSVNVYGYNNAGVVGNYSTFLAPVTALVAAFGAKTYVSEFNAYSTWASVPTSLKAQADIVAKQRSLLVASGVVRAYFFAYNNPPTDDFAGKYTDGNYRAILFSGIGQRPWFSATPNVQLVRSASVSQTATPSRGATPTRVAM